MNSLSFLRLGGPITVVLLLWIDVRTGSTAGDA